MHWGKNINSPTSLRSPQSPLVHWHAWKKGVTNKSQATPTSGSGCGLGTSMNHLKTCLTQAASSGPIPSPGISVTVCRPPYILLEEGWSVTWEHMQGSAANH